MKKRPIYGGCCVEMPEFGQSYAETRSSSRKQRVSGASSGAVSISVHTERIMQFSIIDCCASGSSFDASPRTRRSFCAGVAAADGEESYKHRDFLKHRLAPSEMCYLMNY